MPKFRIRLEWSICRDEIVDAVDWESAEKITRESFTPDAHTSDISLKSCEWVVTFEDLDADGDLGTRVSKLANEIVRKSRKEGLRK